MEYEFRIGQYIIPQSIESKFILGCDINFANIRITTGGISTLFHTRIIHSSPALSSFPLRQIQMDSSAEICWHCCCFNKAFSEADFFLANIVYRLAEN